MRLGPAPCPLCGTEQTNKPPKRAASLPIDPDHYQSSVRELREQLKKLRDEGAEAV
ncbi:MAG: hypothetical protein M3238_00555 [Actinomycetota bacterium]|nr:hypothetical protein [Actinomycetota bacterium]